ncbi:unnamed protein product [Phytomonas sp. Hart1]|nr:unnamed protein product [Phytomonas sp. Hart1]|eukprot:CCW68198.1 unnamed protein product [Phytomonas sp. isolate Hart1]
MSEDQQVVDEELVIPTETMDSHLYYLRYYAGHTGRYGNEFLEFELKDDGTLKYANNSQYRNENIIKKQARVSQAVLEEVKSTIVKSEIYKSDDEEWPQPDRNGRQELEIHFGSTHISLVTNKMTTMPNEGPDEPKGLFEFYCFIRDLKALVLSLVSIHFKIKAV